MQRSTELKSTPRDRKSYRPKFGKTGKDFTLKLKDSEISLEKMTLVMGILNVTPDSFYNGGRYLSLDSALRQGQKMIEEGADIIDVGGESTRPGADHISEEEELKRTVPVIKELARRFDIPISVDTTKLSVAERALEEGASIINDISGLKFEPRIAQVVAQKGAALILMHTPSHPHDMQKKTHYNSLIDDIIESLRNSIIQAEESGVNPQSILVDPGFGFGKTTEQNLSLLKHLREFHILGKPILIGTSRKSFIGKVLSLNVEDRLFGTAATVALGIMNGAHIIRVHDILFMKEVSRMTDAVVNAN